MQLVTPVDTERSAWQIKPTDRMLFVGSCFATEVGQRFVRSGFRAEVNPFGVMYNPVSVMHTVSKTAHVADIAVLTLGTNRVYRLKETGEIVDNCMKRPQNLFTEEQLSIAECCEALSEAVGMLMERNPDVRVVVTVSPIRYRKYGYHGSRLSKATLLLAAEELRLRFPEAVSYFPTYEIMNDELRDYRFHAEDMLHPSQQAVEYICERFRETYFSDEARRFEERMRPVLNAIRHRPFDAQSEEYQKLMDRTATALKAILADYPGLSLQAILPEGHCLENILKNNNKR